MWGRTNNGCGGSDSSDVQSSPLVAGSELVAGQPVYFDEITETVKPAANLSFPEGDILGLAATSVSSGGSVDVILYGEVTLQDWTAVTGTVTLTVGSRYFLGVTPGSMTTVGLVGPGILAALGKAVSSTTLLFEKEHVIQRS